MRSVLSGLSAKLRGFLCIAASAAVMLTTCSVHAFAEADPQNVETGTVRSVDPTGRGEGYSAFLYDNTSGLPTSEANAIAQTDEGFIWIGSYSGLIRYASKLPPDFSAILLRDLTPPRDFRAW